jgi:hypothetical protein
MFFYTKHTWIFRAIIKKYPKNKPVDILEDLIADAPDCEGTWFAAAKSTGLYDGWIELRPSHTL